jgi:Protein of unknown function (DUF2917)
MDHVNDHLASPALTTLTGALPVPKRHYLRDWASQAPAKPAQHQLTAEMPAVDPVHEPETRPADSLQMIQRLPAGQAIKLRARKLSVLRIAHGRVWVTVTDVGPYSRVVAGDHFLSRGESLTLLAGQELVMEPFGRGELASAQFSWGVPGAATVVQLVSAPDWRGGVLQPLLDLRRAASLAVGAMGRLVLGAGHAVLSEVDRVATYVAMIFVAGGAGKSRAGSRFDAENSASGTPCKSC